MQIILITWIQVVLNNNANNKLSYNKETIAFNLCDMPSLKVNINRYVTLNLMFFRPAPFVTVCNDHFGPTPTVT